MVFYTCEKCNKIFKKISNYKQHNQSQKNCISMLQKKIYKCEQCLSNFSSKFNLKKHDINCKKKINVIIKNEKNIQEKIKLCKEKEKNNKNKQNIKIIDNQIKNNILFLNNIKIIKDNDINDNDINDNDINDNDINDNDFNDNDLKDNDLKDNDLKDNDLKDNDLKDNDDGYIYLISQYDVFKNLTIYKIGKTARSFEKRLNDYGIYKVLIIFYINNISIIENHLIKLLKNDNNINKYKGREFFCCKNEKYIIKLIFNELNILYKIL